MSESGTAALGKCSLLRSERCWGSHGVKERRFPGRRNGIDKELAICENIE